MNKETIQTKAVGEYYDKIKSDVELLDNQIASYVASIEEQTLELQRLTKVKLELEEKRSAIISEIEVVETEIPEVKPVEVVDVVELQVK